MVLTTDGNFRGSKVIDIKGVVDKALDNTTSIESVIAYQRTKTNVVMIDGRNHCGHDATENLSLECPAEEMDAEDMLFILYTSGSVVSQRVLCTLVAAI